MAQRRFEVIFFDLGGTLIYLEGQLSKIVDEADKQLHTNLLIAGLDLPEKAFIQDFRSQMEVYHARRETDCREYTTLSIIQKVLEGWGYPSVRDDEIRKAIAAMYAVSQRYWRLERDTILTLQTLLDKQYRLGLISNAGDDGDVQALIDKAGIRNYFDLILTSAGEGVRKPDVHIFRKALDYFSVKPFQVVVVGDSLTADILGAKNIGSFSIWINRRVDMSLIPEKDRRIQPDAAISALEELPPLLEKLEWV